MGLCLKAHKSDHEWEHYYVTWQNITLEPVIDGWTGAWAEPQSPSSHWGSICVAGEYLKSQAVREILI